MLFPFLFLAVSLILGIFLSTHLFLPLIPGLIGMIVCLLCAWIFSWAFRETKAAFVFILLSVFFLGANHHTHRLDTFIKNPLKNLSSPDYMDFQGSLYRSPSRGREQDTLFLKVKKIAADKQEKKIQGNLRITVPHSPKGLSRAAFHRNDKIIVSAKLSGARGYRNFGASSLDQYLQIQNIHRRAFTKSPLLITKLKEGKSISIPRIMSLIRRRMQRSIENHFSDEKIPGLSPEGAVLEALLLGERGRMDPHISRSLQNAGIFHLFAISGAHIAIISFFLFSFFRILKLPDRANYLLLIFFLLLYAMLVEGRPSILRATIMSLAFLVGKVIWRNVNLLNTLSISAFILLMVNPFQLLSIGFQLTFAATLSIILLFPKIIKCIPRLPLRLSEVFALSLAAQVGIFPFVALAFNRITFSALILNFFAIPLVGLIMACGYIFLLITAISPALASLLAECIHFLVGVLISISHSLDPIPGLTFRIPTPSVVIVSGYFISLGLLLFPAKIKGQKRILFACFTIFFLLLVLHPFPSRTNSLKLTFIDVGQGDSILVEFPGTKKMLIDGGGTPDDTFDIGERVVSPFLWKKGIKKIHYLVLTHAHPDHMNGLKSVAANFKIEEFWEALSPRDNQAYTQLKQRLPRSTVCRRMFRGQTASVDGVTIEILNPPRSCPFVPKALNDQSLVLRISYGNTSFLLTGDIDKKIEKALTYSSRTLRSDVLKSPHHGSDTSSSEEFLVRVSPRFVVLTVGAGNRYNLPDPDVLERYRGIGAKVYRTDFMGAVEISSDGRNLSIRTTVKEEKIPGRGERIGRKGYRK